MIVKYTCAFFMPFCSCGWLKYAVCLITEPTTIHHRDTEAQRDFTIIGFRQISYSIQARILSSSTFYRFPEPSPEEGLGVARPAIEDASKPLVLAPEGSVVFGIVLVSPSVNRNYALEL